MPLKSFTTVTLSGNFEDALRQADAGNKRVDLGRRVVDIERRSGLRGHAELLHKRLVAVVARADANAFPVQNARQVVSVNVTNRHRDDTRAVLDAGTINRDMG